MDLEKLMKFQMLLKESIFMDDEYKEYDLNIQMMIYAQIWESHLFLKTLKRIADILNGKPYEWKIPFEQATRKDPSKIISVPKAKFIQEQILAPMSTGHQKMSNLLNSLYDSQLRNDFAHASYYIDFSTGKILSQDSERSNPLNLLFSYWNLNALPLQYRCLAFANGSSLFSY